ncbi:MAG TPA: DUF697 domain-containing protein [Saprospiraceae bacterium]|nr:DUF697 domain-containing protein [Saprospiraceae bacterium]HNM25103.1 DUF697 domain-containing protein [Saprospiraceae bacterium]
MTIPRLVRAISFQRITYFLTLIDLVEQERHLSKAHTMNKAEKQQKATEIIRNHVGFSLGAALVPFPGADLLAVSAVQLNMMRQLAKLYDVSFLDSLGKNIISAVVGGSVARLGASLVKAIPGVGTIIGELSMPVLSGASTYALGRVLANHFQQGGTLADLDLKSARREFEDEIETGKQVATELKNDAPAPEPDATDETLSKLKKMAELRDAGVLTEEEFRELKARLLAQI